MPYRFLYPFLLHRFIADAITPFGTYLAHNLIRTFHILRHQT
jgi:hypothetical protein